MATQIGIKNRLELLSKKSHLSNIPALMTRIVSSTSISKPLVWISIQRTIQTHSFYKYELYDNIPNALNYVDKKTFKPYTKSKKWLG